VLSRTGSRRVPVSSHTSRVPSRPCGAGPHVAKIDEIELLRGGDLVVVAQANVQIDAGIGQKDHSRLEMSLRAQYGA